MVTVKYQEGMAAIKSIFKAVLEKKSILNVGNINVVLFFLSKSVFCTCSNVMNVDTLIHVKKTTNVNKNRYKLTINPANMPNTKEWYLPIVKMILSRTQRKQ